jgi:hypothetical protein
VPGDMTVEQGVNKCGNEAKLKCCNEADYNSGDVQNVKSGLLAGALGGLQSGLVNVGLPCVALGSLV